MYHEQYLNLVINGSGDEIIGYWTMVNSSTPDSLTQLKCVIDETKINSYQCLDISNGEPFPTIGLVENVFRFHNDDHELLSGAITHNLMTWSQKGKWYFWERVGMNEYYNYYKSTLNVHFLTTILR